MNSKEYYKNEWLKFYEPKLNTKYYMYILKKYRPFITEIRKCMKVSKGKEIVELGCGIGSITRALAERDKNFNYICVDNSFDLLNMSQINLVKGKDPCRNIKFINKDITQENSITGNIGHSHGVLEHFTNSEIRDIINIQKRNFDTLIHYVPSDKYDYRSFGNERLIPKEHWQMICEPDEIIEFNDGYDLILKWNKSSFISNQYLFGAESMRYHISDAYKTYITSNTTV